MNEIVRLLRENMRLKEDPVKKDFARKTVFYNAIIADYVH